MSATEKMPPLKDASALVETMSKVAGTLAEDLATRARDPRIEPSLQETWQAEKKAGQTGEAYEIWRTAFCDQVAASWVLCTVFVRTLEDRGFLPHRIAGPGAEDRRAQFQRQFRFLSDRDYLEHIFAALAEPPPSWPRERASNDWVGAQVFGLTAPLWKLSPTAIALQALLDALRATEAEGLRFTFGRPDVVEHDGNNTRFLGDLYQDLNKAVRKRYALLQTPEFVERFILDQTLTPTMEERGIAVTVCDPACGSGHFLLGAFDRLFEARQRKAPGASKAETAQQALSQVYGIDLNPYAAAIARFRLVVSYLDKVGLSSLDQFPADLHVNVFVGDSLLAGQEIQGELSDHSHDESFGIPMGFSLLDPGADALLRRTRFDVVVGNPPYIPEPVLPKRRIHAQLYKSAAGRASLSPIFIERLFSLGNRGASVGQITASSFMKKGLGRAVIEEVFPTVTLSEIIDTSGLPLAGHSTATVILIGRNAPPAATTMARVVSPIVGDRKAESGVHSELWAAILRGHDSPGYADAFVTVVNWSNEKWATFPWVLGGRGEGALKQKLEQSCSRTLSHLSASIGFDTITSATELIEQSASTYRRMGVEAEVLVPYLTGEDVRDFEVVGSTRIPLPYDQTLTVERTLSRWPGLLRFLWPHKAWLRKRFVAGGKTLDDAHLPFWAIPQFRSDKHMDDVAIVFPEIASHNHFVDLRDRYLFQQSAPIIKRAKGVAEEEWDGLSAFLNSSTALFWMRHHCPSKGGADEPWEDRVVRSGRMIEQLPIPSDLAAFRSAGLEGRELGAAATSHRPSSCLKGLVEEAADSGQRLGHLLAREEKLFLKARRRLVALQEQVDWRAYVSYGIVSPEAIADELPAEMSPEERPFEIIMAQSVESSGDHDDWWTANRRTAAVLSERSGDIHRSVDSRVRLIKGSPELTLLEAPECKRRWEAFDWRGAVKEACQDWLWEAIETHFISLRPSPVPLSARSIAQALSGSAKVVSVIEVLTDSPAGDLERAIEDLLAASSVPSASSQIYSDDGVEIRQLWEDAWSKQRRQDAGEAVSVSAPPKYKQEDFADSSMWPLRGKLDVPKERFIAYPTATPPPGTSGKAGLVFGWTGWNHLEQLQAVIALWQDEWNEHGQKLVPKATRQQREGELGDQAAADHGLAADRVTREKLIPLLQTMIDLLPWFRQWHNEDGETADQFDTYVAEECRKLEMSPEDVHLWRQAENVKQRGKGTPKTSAASRPLVAGPEALQRAILNIVRESSGGGGGIEASIIAEAIGIPASKLKTVFDALVEGGTITEIKKRPRTFSLSEN